LRNTDESDADSPHDWIGLEFTEDLDSEAFRRKRRREAKFELWGRGFFAIIWPCLAVVGILQREPGDELLVYFLWPSMAATSVALYLLRRSQLAKETIANEYFRKIRLQKIKLTITTEGDDGTIVGEPLDFYWAYANSFEVVEAGVEATFKHGRKTKTILVPSAMFPDPETMEEFRTYIKGEAARRGLQPKEHWLRPPG
jgi:hypothetical protein